MSPSLEVCSLAARGLRIMASVEQDPDAPPTERYTNEQNTIRVPLLEVIGDPKLVVLGRIEFQRKVRTTVFPATFPCISHLAAWREAYYRWVGLTPLVTGAATRSSTEPILGGPAGSPFARLTPEASQTREYTNV